MLNKVFKFKNSKFLYEINNQGKFFSIFNIVNFQENKNFKNDFGGSIESGIEIV